MIKRIREGTEGIIFKEQYGFRRGQSCVDQVFAVRQMCEKFLAKGKQTSNLLDQKLHVFPTLYLGCVVI